MTLRVRDVDGSILGFKGRVGKKYRQKGKHKNSVVGHYRKEKTAFLCKRYKDPGKKRRTAVGSVASMFSIINSVLATNGSKILLDSD